MQLYYCLQNTWKSGFNEVRVKHIFNEYLSLAWMRASLSLAPRGLQRPLSRLSAVLSIVALARVCPLYQYIEMYVCASHTRAGIKY